MAKMTMKKFEGSAADKRTDAKGAKKAGVSKAKWEGSAADKKADTKALKKINSKRKGC